MSTAGLAACGGSGSKPARDQGETTAVAELSALDYYTDDPANTATRNILNACAATAGIKINRESVPGANLIAKVLQRASSKTLPDLLMLDNPDIQQIAGTGALTPLGDYSVTTEGFAQGVVDAATYQGKLYALQPATNTIAIFYNKEALAKAGVQPPTTWAELRDTAKKLTTRTRYGFAFGATNDYEGTWQFLPAMWTNGGDETNLRSPQVAEALQLWKDLVADGSASKSVVNWSQGDVADQFAAGKAAMMLNGPWNIPVLRKSKIDWGVATFPVSKAGQTSAAPLGGEAWTVPLTGNPARQKKAAEIVRCINSDQNQVEWAKQGSLIPTKTALAAKYGREVPEMRAFVEQVSTARARTGKLGDKWPAAAKVIFTGVQSVLTGQATPVDAMAKAGA